MTAVFIAMIAIVGLLTAFSYFTIVDVTVEYERSGADGIAFGDNLETGSLEMTSSQGAEGGTDAAVTTATGLQIQGCWYTRTAEVRSAR